MLLPSLTHCAAHGGEKAAEVNQHGEWMLDELAKENPAIFDKPKYPMWELDNHFRYF